jgi:DNA topoisomerase I
LGKTDDPFSVSIERAIELIEAKREKDRNALVKSFENDDEMKILNGRWGAYISYKKDNYKIPKGSEPSELSYEDCLSIIEKSGEPKKTKKKGKK